MIHIALDQTTATPGQTLGGSVTNHSSQSLNGAELRLVWSTEGKGTRDWAIVEKIELPNLPPEGQQPFGFTLPEGPYSFSGRLITLTWAVELATNQTDLDNRQVFVLSPCGTEIRLPVEEPPQLS